MLNLAIFYHWLIEENVHTCLNETYYKRIRFRRTKKKKLVVLETDNDLELRLNVIEYYSIVLNTFCRYDAIINFTSFMF